MSQKDRSRQRSRKLAITLCAVGVLSCALLAGCQEKPEGPVPGGIAQGDQGVIPRPRRGGQGHGQPRKKEYRQQNGAKALPAHASPSSSLASVR